MLKTLSVILFAVLISSIGYADNSKKCKSHDNDMPDGTTLQSVGRVFWCSNKAAIFVYVCGASCPMMSGTTPGNCSSTVKLEKATKEELASSKCTVENEDMCCSDPIIYTVTKKGKGTKAIADPDLN